LTELRQAPYKPPPVASASVRCDLCERPKVADDRGWVTTVTHYHETQKPITVTCCPECSRLILAASPIHEPPRD